MADEMCRLVNVSYPATRTLGIEEAGELAKAISLALDLEKIRSPDVAKMLKSLKKDLKILSDKRKSFQSENEQVFLVSEFISAAPFSDFQHLYGGEEHYCPEVEIGPYFTSGNATKGKRVLFNQIGRLLGVDLMINGSDRFCFPPIWTHASGNTNWGNLLIAQDSSRIFSIDHALANITNKKGLEDYCKKVKTFLVEVAKSPFEPVKQIKDLASHFKKHLNLEVDEVGQKSIQLGVLEALATFALVGYTGHIDYFLHNVGLKVGCDHKTSIGALPVLKSTKRQLEQVLKVFQSAYSSFSGKLAHASNLKTLIECKFGKSRFDCSPPPPQHAV